MFRKIILCLIPLLAFGTLGVFIEMRPIPAKHPSLVAAEMPKLLPMHALYANTEARWRYRLSPDGNKLAWLETKWLKPALWVRPLEGSDTEIFHTDDRVRWFMWSANSRFLLYQADRDGWENDVLVSIDTSKPGSKPRSYDFGKDVKSFYYLTPKDGGNVVIVAHNKRDPAIYDLFRLDLDSGDTDALGFTLGNERSSWSFNRGGEIFGRTVSDTKTGSWRWEHRIGKDTWKTLKNGDMEEWFWIAAEPDENGMGYALSNVGRDKAAFVRFSYEDGSEEVLYEDPGADVRGILMNAKTDEPVIAFSQPDYQKRNFFEADLESLLAKLDIPKTANLNIASVTHDFSKLLITVEESHSGHRTILVDRAKETLEEISQASVSRYKDHVSKTEPVFIPARDGLSIPAYLLRPIGVTGPAPMVIHVHGGPVHRAGWGWSNMRSWLVNRGYVVLDVNYRGGSGYGRAFREAAIGEVSRAMHYDVMDARQWAIDKGFADPKKVAIIGGSFGGLKTLTALVQDPDKFVAGIDINGVSDMTTMLREVPVYWTGWPAWYRKYFGDPNDASTIDTLRERSPITHAHKLEAALLIIQGKNDVRVIADQAERFSKALDAEGIEHEYLLIDGGHQIRNWSWQDQIKTMRHMERFLAKHLGGRAQGFDHGVLGAHVLP